jgi:nicotinamidase-related amidase
VHGRDRAALVLVDIQRGFDDPSWGPRDNPDCEHNAGRLLAAWRKRGWPVVFVRHDSLEPGPLAPGTPGNDFKEVVSGRPDLLVTKHVNSAFYGEPDLDAWLRASKLETFVVAGITTNHCCETTARMGGNLGYRVRFCLDATHAFDRHSPEGELLTASELARATATNLSDEFAEIVSTDQLLSEVGSRP